MDWIDLAEDWDRWQAVVNMVTKLELPGNAGNFFAS
jgi:hypothetical protein